MGGTQSKQDEATKAVIQFIKGTGDSKKLPSAINYESININCYNWTNAKYERYDYDDNKVTFIFSYIQPGIYDNATNSHKQTIEECAIPIVLDEQGLEKFNELRTNYLNNLDISKGGKFGIVKLYPTDKKKCLCKDGKHRKVYKIKNKGNSLYVDVAGKPVLLRDVKKKK